MEKLNEDDKKFVGNVVKKLHSNRPNQKNIESKGGEKEMEKPLTLNEYTCERCSHTWLPRSQEKPRVCPKCMSPYWDRPRKNQPSEEETI